MGKGKRDKADKQAKGKAKKKATVVEEEVVVPPDPPTMDALEDVADDALIDETDPHVVVLPISADSIPSHVSWASEAKFPFALVSDPTLATADLYGSHLSGRPVANRTVFVIGKDGRVAYREMKFNALNEDAYTALAAAVAKAR